MEVDPREGAVKRRRVAIEVVNDQPISHYALASDAAVIEVPGRSVIIRAWRCMEVLLQGDNDDNCCCNLSAVNYQTTLQIA